MLSILTFILLIRWLKFNDINGLFGIQAFDRGLLMVNIALRLLVLSTSVLEPATKQFLHLFRVIRVVVLMNLLLN